jgi:clathrin heavy chain
VDVIVASEREQLWDPLVKFLQMCRKKVKEAHIESELIYALAKVNRLAELEEFISGPNCAQVPQTHASPHCLLRHLLT